MTCNICGKHNASIFIQQIIDTKTKEFYICENCAQKYNVSAGKKNASLETILNTLTSPTTETAENEEPVCPECSTPLSRIRDKKELGCPSCFFYFRDTVLRQMEKGNAQIFYTDKLPANLETFSTVKISLKRLKEELEKAVKNEHYELAAYFRDKIKEIEEQA